jgi:murein DD-endopeptidase MepM/ murein hydrolase activator NlpD
MVENTEPVTVEFPLRGEWVAAHTPAERIPSHGTDLLGQRYAYDFIRIERTGSGWKFSRRSSARYLLLGVRLEDCYGWSQPIYSPFEGVVVSASDGWPEKRRLHFLADMGVVLKNALVFDPKKTRDLRLVLGNHVILRMDEAGVYAFFAHARMDSIKVRAGDRVTVGQRLAEVGHSGNSTAPHLHFQLMDRENILEAAGVPCRFREYEALRPQGWEVVTYGIPGKREFIRYTPKRPGSPE